MKIILHNIGGWGIFEHEILAGICAYLKALADAKSCPKSSVDFS